jgi:hypothetical protein
VDIHSGDLKIAVDSRGVKDMSEQTWYGDKNVKSAAGT